MKTSLLIITLSALTTWVGAGAARGDEAQDLARAIAAVDAVGSANTNSTRACARIAAETGTDVRTVEQAKALSGLGYGDLFVAIEIARESNKCFADLAEEHAAGKAWHQLALEAHVQVKILVKAAGHIEAGATKDAEEHHLESGGAMADASDSGNSSSTISRSTGENGNSSNLGGGLPQAPPLSVVPHR